MLLDDLRNGIMVLHNCHRITLETYERKFSLRNVLNPTTTSVKTEKVNPLFLNIERQRFGLLQSIMQCNGIEDYSIKGCLKQKTNGKILHIIARKLPTSYVKPKPTWLMNTCSTSPLILHRILENIFFFWLSREFHLTTCPVTLVTYIL